MTARLRVAATLALALAATGAGAAGPEAASREATVRRVVDGDTLVVGRRERVRLVGVDAPEIAHRNRTAEPYGAEAAAFATRLAAGQRVQLHFDAEAGEKDRYGRTLAYVTLADGTSLNLALIASGHAEAYHALPYERRTEFLAAEREACEQRLGLWAGRRRCPPAPRGDP